MRTVLAPDGHELGTYLRVDELAHRFDVSVDDVLAACSLLGFHATDSHSLIEVAAFTAAVNSAPHPKPNGPSVRTWRPNPFAVVAMGTAAALMAVTAAFVASRGDSSGANGRVAFATGASRSADAYKSALKSTYDATVADAPTTPDYQALAQHLAAIDPPAGLRAEHDALIAEAGHVAELAGAVPECADVPRQATEVSNPPDCAGDELTAAAEASTAADALRDHVGALDGSPTP